MDISIIIVNWNTKDLLRNCLNSIYGKVQGIALEIIVIDNASHDGSVAMLREEFPQVTIIENNTNRGFGAANNQAFGIMKGRYALLLNTDTVLKEHAVYELFSFMEVHPDAAMACGQLLNADGSKQNSIANFPDLLTLFLNTPLLEYLFPKRYPSKRYDYKGPVEVDSGIGACLLVRKQAIDEVGMFDERYFFFFEETDWALQMKTAGWKIYHVPSARIYHLQGQSIGRNVRSRIEFYRSRYQFFKKWKSRSYYQIIFFVIFIRTIINWLLTSLGNLAMLFTNKNLRNKWVVNSKLILWHLNGRP
ncbi:MAG: glycosyltransferase family 2 protein [Desulfovibrionales bacterium]|nr:glycosyltransferase family 2 protein [Desulfovibrionales bacterium]